MNDVGSIGTRRTGLIRRATGSDRVASWTAFVFPLVVAVALGLFLVAPGSLASKAHWALRGLCAQTPSHTLRLGGQPLPFDARMTGIYGGIFMTSVFVLARRRHRCWRLPPNRVLGLLGLSVLAMAVDGTNSLARDLGFPIPYAPDNRLRLLTGLLAGVAIAAMLWYLLGTTLWRRGDPRSAPLAGVGEWGLAVAAQLPFAAAAISGAGILYAPVALLLTITATGVIAALLLAAGLLVLGRDRMADSPADLSLPAAIAFAASLAVIGLLSAGRVALEAALGVPPLT